ncbi:hypothetical protein AWL63_18375 [Sphingomonas panacis]|uniref:Uncharacterized protein n=1 Tax=Sphingomonas panacis TaxID=1560345 RepID=A0A1B3ZHM4_9SPHN|nr:hypothetical protein [Sphingomonas panacis]AOH86929.1 hypothetical protein AWL63_18375 [Sphingomonas panacis]
MTDPNPPVAELDALIAKHGQDDKAIEAIVRGYLRCAIYVYQRHALIRALRHLKIDEFGLSDELVADFQAEGSKYVAQFRDWFVEEFRAFGIKPTSELPN